MKTLRLYLVALLALTVVSCDKEDDLEVKKAVATLYWSGEYAVDGCGFSLQINEIRYKPLNEEHIDGAFKKEVPMAVEVKYVLPGKPIRYNCGLAKNEAEGIRILSLKEIK